MIFTNSSTSASVGLGISPHSGSRLRSSHGVQFLFLPHRPAYPKAFISTSSASTLPLVAASSISSTAANVIMDGKGVAKQIREEIAAEILRMKDAIGVVPGLVGIRFGERKDFGTFLRSKKRACESVGIKYFEVKLRKNATVEQVLSYISIFNDHPSVHAIFVQLPLPSRMNPGDEDIIFNAISPKKNVDDAFHYCMGDKKPLFVPCVARGCIELLHRYNINVEGKRALLILGMNDDVIMGRNDPPTYGCTFSSGLSVIHLLDKENAIAKTVYFRMVEQLEEAQSRIMISAADIIISAVGTARVISSSWINPGAVVIDLGIHLRKDDRRFCGYQQVGDVWYSENKILSAFTPVPGGVGPMTIAMLLSNTLMAAKMIHNFH